ncbi:porin [Bradyrhizobium betae]
MSTIFNNRRAVLAVAAAATIGLAAVIAAPSHAAPVEYVKICSLYGAGFFYIPGTDTCSNANQIMTNQFDLARAQTRASTGTAMAASLVAPWLPTGTNYAVSTHWATYDGQHAAGFSGLMRVSGNFVFSGGFSLGLDKGVSRPIPHGRRRNSVRPSRRNRGATFAASAARASCTPGEARET